MRFVVSIRLSTVVLIATAFAALAPIVLAQGSDQIVPPDRPAASFDLYVDRSDDLNFTSCTAAADDCSLRGAINRANSDPANT